MSRSRSGVVVAIVALLGVACGGSPADLFDADGGPTADGSGLPNLDATADAGTPENTRDAAVDGGSSDTGAPPPGSDAGHDGGRAPDAAMGDDAGDGGAHGDDAGHDAGEPRDAGSPQDAAGDDAGGFGGDAGAFGGDAGTSTNDAGHDGHDAGSATDAGGAVDSGEGGGSDSGVESDGGGAPVTGTVRVHYPAGSHTVTVRGSGAGLSWVTGAPTTLSGTTFTITLPMTGLSGPIEYKPLLDDTTWAMGPNYHVAPGQTVDVYPHFTTSTGQVSTLIGNFQSSVLGNTRPIYAYLPASYTENTVATYPVVYMHDGQNLFAALSQLAFSTPWNVDTAFDTASQVGVCSAGGVTGWGAQPLGGSPVTCTGDGDCPSGSCRTFPEAIIIGVANDANRIYEYTPTVDPTQTSLGSAGGADQYIQMLVTELKPAVDGMLRTRRDVANTYMCGSSLGGLVTAYAGVKRPDVYGGIAALSPSTWWDNDVLVTDVDGTQPAPSRPLMVYVDSGQGSGDDESDTDALATAYLTLGYVDGQNFRHVIQPGAQHSEVYWAQRFPGAMQLLLGVR